MKSRRPEAAGRRPARTRRARLAAMLAVAGLAAAVPLALSACGSDAGTGDSGVDAAALGGAVWRAVEIAGVTTAPAEGAEATATFEGGVVSGSGGVNRYTAAYTTEEPDGITIEQPAATLMAGPEDAMAQEQAYFAALAAAASFAVDGSSLTLMDDQGATLVRFEVAVPTPLAGTAWQALAYNNGKGALQSLAVDSTITAVFGDDGSLSGNASVNQYSTAYSAAGEEMSIDAQIVTTKMAGPPELMEQEAAYLAALPQTATYTIEGDELWLRDAEGAALAHYVAE
ncbi:MAG: META domain-containing protein [Deltaproteobacteria bacterium]